MSGSARATDLAHDELQVAIDRAEEKRREIEAQQPEAQASAKVVSILPKATDLYRQQVELGLDGDQRAAGKARVFLRELLGRIDLEPGENGGQWANYRFQPAALLQVPVFKALGNGHNKSLF